MGIEGSGVTGSGVTGSTVIGSGGVIGGGGEGGGPDPELSFFDDFSSGDLTHTENGISYFNTPNVVVVTNGPIQNRHNARFRFGPDDIALGEESWAELAWRSLTLTFPDLWMGYYCHIPANYFHADAATRPNQLNGFNNKGFCYSWDPGGDSTYGSSLVGMGTNLFPNGDGTSKASHYLFGAPPGDDEHQGPSTYPQYFPQGVNILIADDLDEVLQIVVHHKYATQAAPAADGMAEIWKRRVDATTLEPTSAWIKLLDITDGDWYQAAAVGFGSGYLLGYANSGFTAQTDIHITDLWIADYNYWEAA